MAATTDPKKISQDEIKDRALSLKIDPAALIAVMQVECKESGFQADGQPVILFERHVFRQRLFTNHQAAMAEKAMKERPDLCNTTTGGYGLFSIQHQRLADAVKYHRQSALESASWGLGQIMGYHWQGLGYQSCQDFVNAMYQSESAQLDAMCRFISKNGLVPHLKSENWADFARRYNGPAYLRNRYDSKLKAAFDEAKIKIQKLDK